MNEFQNVNEVLLSGHLVGEFVFSHENNGEKFYENFISVKRKSGVSDEILVIVSEIFVYNINVEEKVLLFGDIRTHNVYENTFPKMKMFSFAKEMENTNDDEFYNVVKLSGTLCRCPIYRTTPKGREISELILAVNRTYGKSDYVPCICWGRNAKMCMKLKVGSKIELTGRIQSRVYQKIKGDITQKRTTYEVSVIKLRTVVE